MKQEEGLPDARMEAFRELVVRQGGTVRRARRCAAILSAGGAGSTRGAGERAQGAGSRRRPTFRAPWACRRARRSPTCRFICAAATGRWAKKCRDASRASSRETTRPPVPPGQSGRLQLAEWLTKPDHPLTSRVMANRIWRWHFGRGIVPSVDNFGRLGEAPDQPAAARLAGAALRRAGLEHQADAPHDHARRAPTR